MEYKNKQFGTFERDFFPSSHHFIPLPLVLLGEKQFVEAFLMWMVILSFSAAFLLQLKLFADRGVDLCTVNDGDVVTICEECTSCTPVF